ncbi:MULTISPECIES: sigma-70 family RNA polymerase sigma factor [unclassified Oceanobacillus]|uniref:sigma-70 family RNA polymerase sigma factor n=1 Tax=unclassified Oceanobacillus TaxID=2630292 RepID=UPI00300E4EAD
MDDLIQVGRIALWKASENFRPMEDGLSFDSYAHRIIRLKLLDYLSYLKRPIRQCDYSESINAEIVEGIEIVETIHSEINLEEQALDRFYFEEVSSGFNKQENNLFHQRIAGYTYKEIQSNLGIKGKSFKVLRANMVEKIKNHQRQLVI